MATHLLSLWKTRLGVLLRGGTERLPRILRLRIFTGSPVVGGHPIARLGAAGDRRLVAGVGRGLLVVVSFSSGKEGAGYEKCLSLFSTSNLLSREWWWWWGEERGRAEWVRGRVRGGKLGADEAGDDGTGSEAEGKDRDTGEQ